jgi:hypothetical protein
MDADIDPFLTAIHEAGHAVILQYFHIRLASVAIRPARGLIPGEGKTEIDTEVPQPPLKKLDRAVIALAGFAAEARHNPDAVSWQKFDDCQRYAMDRRALDAALSSLLSRDADDTEPEFKKLREREFERANEFLAEPACWRACIALATRLVEVHQVTGEEATRILDEELRRGNSAGSDSK